jgi:hypothetical protein
MKHFFLYRFFFGCIFVLVVISNVHPQIIFAAKKRIRVTNTKAALSYSSARLSRSTNSIIVSFKNLSSVSNVSYELSYNANGISQGAAGSFLPAGSTDSRDLYFGTCSKGVCTPHTNITNAELLVVIKTTQGKTNTKLYRVRI